MENSPFVILNVTCSVLIPFLIWMATTATVDNLHVRVMELEEKLAGTKEELEQAEECSEDAEKKLEDLKTSLRKLLD
jgi:F0F1-type ATP synthase membrane subunit b/b'